MRSRSALTSSSPCMSDMMLLFEKASRGGSLFASSSSAPPPAIHCHGSFFFALAHAMLSSPAPPLACLPMLETPTPPDGFENGGVPNKEPANGGGGAAAAAADADEARGTRREAMRLVLGGRYRAELE